MHATSFIIATVACLVIVGSIIFSTAAIAAAEIPERKSAFARFVHAIMRARNNKAQIEIRRLSRRSNDLMKVESNDPAN